MIFKFNKQFYSPVIVTAFLALAGVAGQAQTLTIVNGQGQIVGPSNPALLPLTVQLLDAAGKPFPGQTITFTDNANGAYGSVNGNAAPTDANGITSVQFIGANLSSNVSSLTFVQATITAGFGGLSATFIETTSANVSGGLLVQSSLLSPLQGETISGTAGSTGAKTIRVQVNSLSSTLGIPNVAVSLSVDTSDPNAKGSVSCKEGPIVLTDATGVATCSPVFGKVGTGTFTITVGGGFRLYLLNQFVVTVGPPAIISVTSGAGQSGLPGQTLPFPIVATVTDLAGNPIGGVQVVYESVTPGGVTFTNSRTTSATNGQISTNVTLGSVPGPLQIRIRDAANAIATPALVTVTVTNNISGLSIVRGNGQTVFINAAFAPITVQVNGTSGVVPSATITFAVTSGSATVSPSTVLTDVNGQASTAVTAGPTPGPITITATTATGLTQTFNLTANPPGPINLTYFNGASFELARVSPGAIVTITAQGLVGANVQGVVGGTLVGVLPYTVAGVSVTIDSIPAPIFYVANQNGQQSVTVQVPFEARATTVPITINVSGGGSTSAFVTLQPLAPGLFETVTPSDNLRRVVALRPNGTVVTPANPAGRGENIRVYLTGLGAVSPSVPTGTFSPAGSDPVVTSNIVVGLNNNGVQLVQAIYARNLIGVYEVTFTVPTDTVAFPSGTVNFSVAVQGANGFSYSNPSAIAIQ